MTDVLIAGGGPSGLAAAIALAGRGVSVTVADATGAIPPRRGELLPQGAATILERLGLGDVLASALAIEDVASLWGTARLQAHGAYPGLGLHGWGIDRQTLSKSMLRRVQALGVRVLRARVMAHDKVADGWQIGLKGPSGMESMLARYLIDATGRPASIARRHGAMLLQGTDLVAVIWHVPGSRSGKMVSEAMPDGWWYAVPFPGGSTLGFLTGTDHAKEVSRAPADFLAAAREGFRLISVADTSANVQLMDSRSSVLDKLCGPGWLATGDAAAAFDPIASQGLFNALSGGFFAGHAAADALAGDEDAPLVYQALAARTAERTFSLTHLQYAAMPHDTLFWHQRSRPGNLSVS